MGEEKEEEKKEGVGGGEEEVERRKRGWRDEEREGKKGVLGRMLEASWKWDED